MSLVDPECKGIKIELAFFVSVIDDIYTANICSYTIIGIFKSKK